MLLTSSNKLLQVINSLYPKFSYITKGGVCYGYAAMGMQALIGNELPLFNHRLSLIGQIKPNDANDELDGYTENDLTADEFAKVIRGIELIRVAFIKTYREELLLKLEKKINMDDHEFYALLKKEKDNPFVEHYHKQCAEVDNELNIEQRELIDIRTFLEGILIHYAPHLFQEFFETESAPKYQNVERTFLTLLPEKLLEIDTSSEEKKAETDPYLKRTSIIKKVDSFIGLYNLDELKIYFEQLHPKSPGFDRPIAFLMRSSSHAITVGYDSRLKCWQMIDAEKSYSITCKTDAEIAERVMSTFSNNNTAVFKTELFCHQDQLKDVNNWFTDVTTSSEWKKIQDINGKQALTDSQGGSLLWSAVEAGRSELVNELCSDPNINVNQAAYGNMTPLYLAAERGKLDIVETLLNHPDINTNSKEETTGATPIHIACQQGHIEIVQALLNNTDHPVDINMKANGKTALDIAKLNGKADIISLLLAYQSKLSPAASVLTENKTVEKQSTNGAENHPFFSHKTQESTTPSALPISIANRQNVKK